MNPLVPGVVIELYENPVILSEGRHGDRSRRTRVCSFSDNHERWVPHPKRRSLSFWVGKINPQPAILNQPHVSVILMVKD